MSKRVIMLSSLDPAERRLILALVAAAAAKKKAAALDGRRTAA